MKRIERFAETYVQSQPIFPLDIRKAYIEGIIKGLQIATKPHLIGDWWVGRDAYKRLFDDLQKEEGT